MNEYEQLPPACRFYNEAHAMILCVCHRVSDQTIAKAARLGHIYDDIHLELGVATK
jgi:hypothetical protein